MKSWPELLALVTSATLCAVSVVLAEPPTIIEPWCPAVECPAPCSPDDCHAAADAECQKYAGPEYFAMAYCARGAR